MKNLKKGLQVLSRELKALTKKSETLMKAVEKLEKTQPAQKQKTIKAKATPRKGVAKKAIGLTATDQVLKIIKRSRGGADVPTLMKKTQFDETKVRNIIFRAFKQGKIKRAGRGVYVIV